MPEPVAEHAQGPVDVQAAGFSCGTAGDVRTCVAVGRVTLDSADAHVEAESGVYTDGPGGRSVQLGAGFVDRASSPRLVFQSATWRPPADFALGALSTPAGGGLLTATSASSTAAGVSAEGLRFAPCACDDGRPTALTLGARSAELVRDDAGTWTFVRLRGGTVRLFDYPVLPLPPLRVPLDPDRLHLLLPELGYGTPGFSANLHGQVGLDGWRVTGGPDWRQDRGGRLEIAAAGPGAALDRLGGSGSAVVGYDALTSTVRGAVSSRAGVVVEGDPSVDARGRDLRVAWDVDVLSDATYADDYGSDWVSRGLPRQEQRGTLAYGPLRVAVDHATEVDRPLQQVEARVRTEVTSVDDTVIAARAAVGGWGTDPAELAPSAEVGVDGYSAWAAGPVRVSGAGDAAMRAIGPSRDGGSTAALGLGRGNARVEVPMWTGRLQLWPGLEAAGNATANPATLRDLDGHAFVGAGTRADLVIGDWLFAGSAHAGQDEAGWTGRATLDLDGPFHIGARVGRRQQGGEVGLGTHPVSGTVGVVHRTADDQLITWASIDLRASRFRVGGSVSTPVGSASPAWSSRAFAGYDDGCTRLLLTAALSPDRDFPDLGVKAEVRR